MDVSGGCLERIQREALVVENRNVCFAVSFAVVSIDSATTHLSARFENRQRDLHCWVVLVFGVNFNNGMAHVSQEVSHSTL